MPDQSDDLEDTQQHTPFRPYHETGGQGCAVSFVGHTKIGPPRVPVADSFVQYTFNIRTEASGTLDFSERYSTMYARHRQLKQQKALEHYDPPLVFPGKGSVMPWWPGADKRIVERGEKLADYYQRLVCEATTETLETLGTCWPPGYTLHEVAPKSSAAEPVASLRVPAVVSSNQEELSTEEGPLRRVVERQERLDALPSRESSEEGAVATQDQLLVADSDTPELQQQQQQQRPVAVKDSQQTKSAAWWIGLLVLLVAAVLGGIMTYPTLFLNETSLVDALPLGGVPARGKIDQMRANLQAAEASRHADLASADEIDVANTAEVERAHQLKAGLEMRRRQLSIAEEEKRRLQAAEKQREKQRAAYEASMVRKRAQRHTYTQHQPDLASAPVGTEAPAKEAITTKHGCTCLPTTVDHSDPRAPVEWGGCASRTATIIFHFYKLPVQCFERFFPNHTCVSHASTACRSGEQVEQQAGVMWNQDAQVHSSLVCRCTMALMSVDDALQFHSCVRGVPLSYSHQFL